MQALQGPLRTHDNHPRSGVYAMSMLHEQLLLE